MIDSYIIKCSTMQEFLCSFSSRMDKKPQKRSLPPVSSSTKVRKLKQNDPSANPVASSGVTMTPSQHTGVPTSQQASSSGVTMTHSQHTGIPASHRASNSGVTVTPGQHIGVPPPQQASGTGASQVNIFENALQSKTICISM